MQLLRHRGLQLALALALCAGIAILVARFYNGDAAVQSADPRMLTTYTREGFDDLQQARSTGDPTYYTKADAAFTAALKSDPQSVDALVGRAALKLGQHQFHEALALGQQAHDLDPSRTLTFGVIGDAQVELGMYDQAAETMQTMVNMRPDLSSYSRAAYIRELNGDVPGAIELMGQAATAGGNKGENVAWVRVQLGNLYFNRGDLDSAEREYQHALVNFPGYIYAQAGLGQVRAAQGRYDEARPYYNGAIAHIPLPQFVIGLGEMEQAAGHPADAAKQYDLVRFEEKLFAANGVNSDMEMALFEADHGDPAAALAQARKAYAERPNVKAADTLAWALSQAGQQAEARRYSDEALKLGTQDALFFYHAGMIAARASDWTQAHARLEQTLAVNPYFSVLLATQARHTLDTGSLR